MKETTFVIVRAFIQDKNPTIMRYYCLMNGILTEEEAENKLRNAVALFFEKASRKKIKEVLIETSNDLNWGDVLGQGMATDYFKSCGIKLVNSEDMLGQHKIIELSFNHDEVLIPW